MQAVVIVASAILMISTFSSFAGQDWEKAVSRRATSVTLCKGGSGASSQCDALLFGRSSKALDIALAHALTRADPMTAPLLLRDQVWAKEMIESHEDILEQAGAEEEVSGRVLKLFAQRISDLEAIGRHLGRPGFTGLWANAFGRVELRAAENGYRISVHTESVYGRADEHVHTCALSADVSSSTEGWLDGTVKPDRVEQENASSISSPPHLKLIRQGETMRLVATETSDLNEVKAEAYGCSHQNQITGTYFPISADQTNGELKRSSFIAPTFDCSSPLTPTDEEICADPELALGDRALNNAWRHLMQNLDDRTIKNLSADQRSYLRAQAHQFEKFLHPSWEKSSEEEHFTYDARQNVSRLQNERLALLAGLEPSRSGLLGLWLASDAILEVSIDEKGQLFAKGSKWDEMDYRRTCSFDLLISGDGQPARLRAEAEYPTSGIRIQREHTSLDIKTTDAARVRESLCLRGLDADARLFPVRPSPHISVEFRSIR